MSQMRAQVAGALVLGFAGMAPAATIVLGPGQNIQAAVATAANGDRIELQPGVYHGAVDYLGKTITIVGQAGAASTTLDGTGLGVAVVTFRSGESPSAVLEGVTVTGGHVSNKAGGGIRCANGSNPTILRCHILGNTASAPGAGPDVGGGGVAAIDSSPTLEQCVIAGNTGSAAGGLLMYGGFVTLTDCAIRANAGRGIHAKFGGSLTLERCKIEDHVGEAGALVDGVFLTATDCTFARNTGRGLMYFTYGDLVFARNTFLDNSTSSGAGGGLGIWTAGGSIRVESCLFAGNQAPQGAAASLAVTEVGDVPPESIRVESCTFVDNGTGSAIYSESPGIWLHQSIVRGPGSLFSGQPNPVYGNLVVSYSNVQGGAAGTGNFDADPLFVDVPNRDYHLRVGSPCFAAGDPAGPFTALDRDGDPRDFGGNNDLGADERKPTLAIDGNLFAGGTAWVGIHGNPSANPALLFVSSALGSAPNGGFLLAPPLLAFALPPLPASGALTFAAVIPPGTPPVRLYAQAWTGAALTAAEVLNLW